MNITVQIAFAILQSDGLASALMTLIEAIREKVSANAFEFSQHAVDQAILRRISVQEIREAIGTGKAIHVQCSYPVRTPVKIITVYEPDPNEWIGYEQRRG